MPVDRTFMTINTTSYEITLDSIEYSDGVVSVEITTERSDETTALVEEAEVSLIVGGEVVDTTTESITSRFGHSFGLSGPASSGDSIAVEVDAVNWDESASVSGTVPEPSVDPDLVSVECSISSDVVDVGDTVVVSATVNNDNDRSVDVGVDVSFADATESDVLNVPAESSADLDVEFETNEPGEYEPEITHEVG